MLFKRAIAATTAGVAAAAFAIAIPAQAAGGLSAQDLADNARAAATAADQAFIDARWSDVSSAADAFEAAYADLLALRAGHQEGVDDAQSGLDNANDALADAQAGLTQATDAAADAQDAYDAAVATYNATIGSSLGLPSQWTSLNPNPVKISDLPGAIANTQSQIAAAVANVAAKQAAYNAATGFAKIAAGVALGVAQAQLAGLQAAAGLLQQAYTNVNGPALAQAVEDAQDALDEANLALENAEDAVDEAQADVEYFSEMLSARQSVLDDIDALIAGLADAVQSVSDRRADLVDLDTVKHTVVWTLGADNTTPRAGDIVKLTFTVPNSELFALSGAQVKVTSPAGITPSCDIVGGVVAAGATVTCQAVYVPTDADAAAGQVVFEVELTGYIPLGPGNPRAAAATQTLISTTQSVTVPVAARLVQATDDDPADEELSETGFAQTQTAALAVMLVLAGAGLIVARRRFMGGSL